ncbi:MAG TPA: hypothetical protein PLF13_06485 [candidate division Zixibacteria bacterium]|nr:hypothetical protein [candidate division Zixibacteria bacterium]
MTKCVRLVTTILALFVICCGSSALAQGTDPGTPDTLRIESITAYQGSPAEVPVYFYNDENLGGVEITLEFNSSDIYIDSVSFVGSRVETMSSTGYTAGGTTVTFYVIGFSDVIEPGSGLLATLHCGYPSTITPQIVSFDTTTIISGDVEYSTTFSDELAQYYIPEFVSGQIDIQESGCCIGDRGNINNSEDDVLDISDVVYLVNYMFQQGPAPVCMDEANVNGSELPEPDISDLVYLASYMFNQGPPPVPCH